MTETPCEASKLGQFSWALFDWANQPFFTIITTFIFAPYFANVLVGDPVKGQAAWAFTQSTSGILIALMSPFVGAMADYWGMSEAAIGTLVSYEFLGTSITTILGIFFLHRPNWPLRTTAYSALSLFVLGNLVTPFIHELHWALVSVRIVCGLCAGLTWIVVIPVHP